MDAEIRRAEPGDWEVLRDVRLAALADTPYAFMATLAQEQEYGEPRWRERIAKSAFFLAWDGARPVGIVGAFSKDGSGWHVMSMWVTPAARGTGVAGRLIDAVTGYARAQGAAALTLWVTEGNDRARAFYQRQGFQATGSRQPVRPETPDDWEEEMLRSL
ncbi:MAG TPA: GNAT family N-acetyltransferase [Streptosporangiaceae bacterium]